MKVTQVMASAVQALQPDDSVYTAARLMKKFDVGCLPVVGSEGRVAGIVTDRDLVLRGITGGNDTATISVAEVMTPDPVFCTVEDTVRQAARIMEENEVRRLPVLREDRTVAGMVSLGDICNHSPHNIAGELIKAVSKPAHHALLQTV